MPADETDVPPRSLIDHRWLVGDDVSALALLTPSLRRRLHQGQVARAGVHPTQVRELVP